MSCGIEHRCGSDLVLLWLWCRPSATVPVRPLASMCCEFGPKKTKRPFIHTHTHTHTHNKMPHLYVYIIYSKKRERERDVTYSKIIFTVSAKD